GDEGGAVHVWHAEIDDGQRPPADAAHARQRLFTVARRQHQVAGFFETVVGQLPHVVFIFGDENDSLVSGWRHGQTEVLPRAVFPIKPPRRFPSQRTVTAGAAVSLTAHPGTRDAPHLTP